MLCWLFHFFEHLVFTVFVIIVGHVWYNHGLYGVLGVFTKILKAFPGAQELIQQILSGEVRNFTKEVKGPDGGGTVKVKLPEEGVPHDELLSEMEKLKAAEANPEDGKMFAYVYTGDGDHFKAQQKAFSLFTEKTGMGADHDQLVGLFHHAFMHENALNPAVFPSLRRFENEVISMTSDMLNGDDEVVGSLTSGGTESILMAMKSYRDRAKKLWPRIKNPQMVAPITIHPAHEKAANYFGFEIIHVPVSNTDFKPDIEDYERAITPNTIALLSSATQYCHGVVDPIEEIAEIARRKGLPLHVDACFGGFMLPWVEQIGYPVPKFDFRVPGVTSISADIHKYGFGAKGASVVLYKNSEIRKHQIFAYAEWPGGLFGSPSMAGTRPGGNIAAAWVALKAMGKEGYKKMATQLMDTTNKLKDGINKIPGLYILGKPCMTAFAMGSNDPTIDIMALADVMEASGWKIERQQYPDSLHCTIMPHHTAVADELLKALADAAAAVKGKKELSKKGSAAMYGMVANIPDKSIVGDFIVEFFSEVYKL